MSVRWMPITGFEGVYSVSTNGDVKSHARKDSRGHRRKEKLLKPGPTRDGYRMVKLCTEYGKKCLTVHRLVAMAFIPNPLAMPQVNHIDGVKSNNSLDNLEWSNSSLNQLHAIKLGLRARVNSGSFKLIADRRCWNGGCKRPFFCKHLCARCYKRFRYQEIPLPTAPFATPIK